MRQKKITRYILCWILPVAFLAAGFNCLKLSAFAFYPPESQKLLENYRLTVFALDKEYQFCYPEIDTSGGKVYLKNLEEIVDGIYYDSVVRPVDAQVKVAPAMDQPFTYSAEKSGKGVNKEKLSRQIEVALSIGQPTVKAEIIDLLPAVSVEGLKEKTKLLSSFQTDYSFSSAERKHNIELAVRYLGWVRIPNGETFSFNDSVGERTEKRGFKQAKIIMDGNYIDGTGGGVCQVSSTVYNAGLIAGLKATERRAHSLLVSYVEPSFDAMVNSGSSDLKLQNQTGEDVYITCRTLNGKIEVRIFGKKGKSTYRRVSEVKEYISPPQTEEVESEQYCLGERIIKVNEKKGAKSVAYLERYEDGKLVERKKLSSDTYSPVKGVTIVGTAPLKDEINEEMI
ncbi:MAG: VanW family protein [Clostridia bacterium]|nr:VanW family protein [Clostridia bacterium]